MESKDKRTKALADLILKETSDMNLIEELTSKLSLSKGQKARNDIISSIKSYIPELNFKQYAKRLRQRSFKVVVSSLKAIKGLDQKIVDEIFHQGDEFYGRYLGDSPNQAAKKAFTQIFRKLRSSQKVEEDIEIDFFVKESTNESDKKEYSYRGIASFQPRYMIVRKDQNGKRRVEYTSEDKDMTITHENNKDIIKRYDGEEIHKILFKSKVISLKNAIK